MFYFVTTCWCSLCCWVRRQSFALKSTKTLYRIPCSSVCSRFEIICIINIFMITKFVGHELFFFINMMLNKKKLDFFKTKFVYRNCKLNVKGRLFFSNITDDAFFNRNWVRACWGRWAGTGTVAGLIRRLRVWDSSAKTRKKEGRRGLRPWPL